MTFDAAVRNPEQSLQLRVAFDSGDAVKVKTR
jgi:hypothetical protein